MANLKVQKIADKNYLLIADTNIIKYSIIITNEFNYAVNVVTIRDLISKGARMLIDTIIINNKRADNCSCDQSITIPSIGPGENAIITFCVEVDTEYPPDTVVNKALVSYFDVNNIINKTESNELIVPVINLQVCMAKNTDKMNVCVGEVIDYEVFIRNESTIEIKDATFYDILQEGIEVLPASVKINSISQYSENLSEGLFLGVIPAKTGVVINFAVRVTAEADNNIICNRATMTFNYSINDGDFIVTSTGESQSNCTFTKIN